MEILSNLTEENLKRKLNEEFTTVTDYQSLNNYREYVQSMSIEITKINNFKDYSSLLKGYVIIETNTENALIPNHLYHFFKGLNYVFSIPNRMSIPESEVQSFFTKFSYLDVPPSYYEEVECLN